MGNLKDLFDRLNETAYCRYSQDGSYPLKEGDSIVELRPQELLEVGGSFPHREQVMIAYFGETPTRVLYFGEDAHKMFLTLQALKIPKHPSNLGEIVFKIFGQHLETDPHFGKPISLEQKVLPGEEHQFRVILKKLIQVYSGCDIDKCFYTALRKGTFFGALFPV